MSRSNNKLIHAWGPPNAKFRLIAVGRESYHRNRSFLLEKREPDGLEGDRWNEHERWIVDDVDVGNTKRSAADALAIAVEGLTWERDGLAKKVEQLEQMLAHYKTELAALTPTAVPLGPPEPAPAPTMLPPVLPPDVRFAQAGSPGLTAQVEVATTTSAGTQGDRADHTLPKERR